MKYKTVLFAERGFCNNDINYISLDDRGEYNWTETKVGDILMKNCFYNEEKFARRECVDHDFWDSPDSESELDYDGTQCITLSTSILQGIANVRHN
ncbi:MAG: hypothetical protein A6F71_09245 [Cycloclasticus sp. symbiont of Poecilosclerida sp. M]|nr:MAG: hypothetical protein A6F71_09245 [Cycloclasticus sp. symbiont of Poecilosclerida sp. M]